MTDIHDLWLRPGEDAHYGDHGEEEGWARLIRKSLQANELSAVVLRFSRTRERYERQGLLSEPAALEVARGSR